jgi:hypothetical protein
VLIGFGKNNLNVQKNIKEIKDLKNVRISGKRKSNIALIILGGALNLIENEKIVQIFFDDNTCMNFTPKMRGKLIEINSQIFMNPDLIKNSVKSL